MLSAIWFSVREKRPIKFQRTLIALNQMNRLQYLFIALTKRNVNSLMIGRHTVIR